MALPVTIPNEFANATASIPLSQLDTNFNTLANAVNGISDGSETLANVSVTGGTISNVAVSATTLNTSGQVVFNDAGADVDFRVEGDTDANLLFVDGGADAIGVGFNNTASAKFGVVGNVGTLDVSGNTLNNIAYFSETTAGGRLYILGNGLTSTSAVTTIHNGTNGGALAFSTRLSSVNTERMRLTSDGYLRMSASSGGIQFGGDTAAANALDDYEEGTFTPVLADATSGGNTASTDVATGYYTKIGNLVKIHIEFVNIVTTGMTSGNNLIFRNLPFTAATAVDGVIRVDQFTFAGYLTAQITATTTYGAIRKSVSTDPDAVLTVAAVISGGADLFIDATYFAS